ncbi:hypothetical protein CK203_017278 [Vitis vinifera]|uniref:Uncharacterized protein n=1 Tax=Vitis vinifera TaxID=29760 RepID=A0A438JZC5_VITVI|nr:hypothetical protein CK203_017278 [Vitis vinifera]
MRICRKGRTRVAVGMKVAWQSSGWCEAWSGEIFRMGSLNARVQLGVVVFWDNRVLELVGMEVGLFSISCRFKNCEDGFRWIFSGVYGPTMKRYRELFWEELGAIRGLWNDSWCIAEISI